VYQLPSSFLCPRFDETKLGPVRPDHPISLTVRLRRETCKSDFLRFGGFATRHGLSVVEMNQARRSVTLEGTATQVRKAFAVELNVYESSRGRYRGRHGYIHVPRELAGTVQGIFGLDNHPIGGRNGHGVDGRPLLTPVDVARLYAFPSGRGAAGQTIGVLEFGGGYYQRDVDYFFDSLGVPPPRIIEVEVDGASNSPERSPASDREVLMDICIAGAVAPGATIAVYFAPQTERGWVDALDRAVHPGAYDPAPSVLSISWYVAEGDDRDSLRDRRVTLDAVDAISAIFRDAAFGESGVTVFVASGDTGTHSEIDGKARVQYPASDPWVTSCGGTTISNVNGNCFDEGAWHFSGGGVSAHFSLPTYQACADIPVSVNDGKPGRGVPDIAGNASPASGYRMELKGAPFIASKTSVVPPLYAGLTALLNANLGWQVGFLNPILYELGADSPIFRGIADGTTNGSPGYRCRPGWDACTGWGSLNGTALLNELRWRARRVG